MVVTTRRKTTSASMEDLQQTEANLCRVIELQPENHQAYFFLGMICQQMNRLAEAEQFFSRAIDLQPIYPEAYYHLGLVCRENGRFKEAKILVKRAVELKPAWAVANNTLGILYNTLGRTDKAKDCFVRALKIKPDFADAYNNLGSVQADNKLWAEAEVSFRRAAQMEPGNYQIHNNLARTLRKLKRYAEAEDCYRRVIKLNPRFVEGYNSLGLILKDSGRLDEAAACLYESIKLQPDDLVAYHYLAVVLAMDYQFEKALGYLQRALKIDPAAAETYRILGRVLKMMQRLDEAEFAYRRAIELSPAGQAEKVNFGLGTLYLIRGQYEKAWPYFEMRLGDFKHKPKVNYWQGESLSNKKILLFFEQGFGDTMQFVRYIPLVTRQTAQTMVKVQKPLVRLIGNSFNCKVLTGGREALDNIDYVCSLLSLPYIFNTTEETIPRDVYLRSGNAAARKWCQVLEQAGVSNGRLRVGVVWSGNPKHKNDCNRSIPFEFFSQMFDQIDVSWVSLQVGQRTADLTNTVYPVADFAGQFEDFLDTAGMIANLDIVVTVDSAVAHLAAAMGKKTWILIPYIVDWRWQLDREDCPWYPSVRLFRQQISGDWTEVINRVKAALAEEVNSLRFLQ